MQQDGFARHLAIYFIPLIELLSYLPIADLSRLRLDFCDDPDPPTYIYYIYILQRGTDDRPDVDLASQTIAQFADLHRNTLLIPIIYISLIHSRTTSSPWPQQMTPVCPWCLSSVHRSVPFFATPLVWIFARHIADSFTK